MCPCKDITDSDDDREHNAGPRRLNAAGIELDDSEVGSDDDNRLVDTWGGHDGKRKKPYEEDMRGKIQLLRDFCDSLEYQIQFRDSNFLETLEKDGTKLFNLVRNCLSHEKRENSSREASPTTWERSTANAMFYQSRPLRDH